MVNIKLGKLEAGMVLSQNVKDRSGRVLVTAGQKITEKHLAIFKDWGVTDVAIESPEGKTETIASAGNFDPATVEKVERIMKDMFRHADLRHPAVRELFNLCVARNLKAQDKVR